MPSDVIYHLLLKFWRYLKMWKCIFFLKNKKEWTGIPKKRKRLKNLLKYRWLKCKEKQRDIVSYHLYDPSISNVRVVCLWRQKSKKNCWGIPPLNTITILFERISNQKPTYIWQVFTASVIICNITRILHAPARKWPFDILFPPPIAAPEANPATWMLPSHNVDLSPRRANYLHQTRYLHHYLYRILMLTKSGEYNASKTVNIMLILQAK